MTPVASQNPRRDEEEGAADWWDREIFYSHEAPDGRCPEIIDLAGRRRDLVYGPYRYLSPGIWRATVSLELSPAAAESSLEVQLGILPDYVGVDVPRGVSGLQTIEIEHRVRDRGPAEVRLRLKKATSRGAVRFLGARIEPAASARPAAGDQPAANMASPPPDEGFYAPRALGPRLTNLRLALLGSCQVGHLANTAASMGYVADHMLYEGDRRAELPNLDTSRYDAAIVGMALRQILRDADGRAPDLAHLRGWDADAVVEACSKILRDRLSSLSDHLKFIPTFILTFNEPSINYMGILLPRSSDSFIDVVDRLNDVIISIIREYPNFYTIDSNSILNSIGRFNLQDDLVSHATHASFIGDWDISQDSHRLIAPVSHQVTYKSKRQIELYGQVLLDSVADSLKIIRQIDAVKLIIVDLDDTLWRGVAAEDSAESWWRVEGWPLGFVEALLYFKSRGGLLAICSKNERDSTLLRFSEIWRDRITPSDFVSIKINWESKAANIAQILDDTNILPESALFFDDNPREIDEVRSRFPMLRCLGGNHYDWRRIVLCSPETQAASVSAESLKRTETTRARINREMEAQTMSRGEWLESLHLRQRFTILRNANHPFFSRTIELINKTNQFNTTGKRWTPGELIGLLGAGGACVLSSLADRTIDNGMTGVVIVKGDEILQAVLSCRVFGLGAELGMARVATLLALANGPSARAHVVDTGKNFACHDYFTRAGFSAVGDQFETAGPCPIPDWIQASFTAADGPDLSEADWLALLEQEPYRTGSEA